MGVPKFVEERLNLAFRLYSRIERNHLTSKRNRRPSLILRKRTERKGNRISGFGSALGVAHSE